MNYAGRIRELRVYFDCESNAKLERVLGLCSGYLRLLDKKEKTNGPVKILLALLSKGISTDWFLTGEGPMIKPQEPEEYGTKAQGVSVDNRSGSAFPLADGEGHYNLGMSLRDYFAGQALAGFCSKQSWDTIDGASIALWAYEIADDMIVQSGRV